MNTKRALITGVILFVVLFILDFIIHGGLLSRIYQATASVWRPEAEMKHLFYFMLIGQLFFGIFFAIIFALGYEIGKPGVQQGLRFGVLVALLIAPISSLGWYVILPIPGILAFYWLVAGIVEMIILGLLAGLIYKPRQI